MSARLVSIIIVNYETSTFVKRCLESLASQDQPHEIIVVDNPSPVEDWRNLPEGAVHVIRNEKNVGYGLACNAGADVARPESEFVCILNPDTVVPQGMLGSWISRHKTLLPAGGILAPRLINENGVEQKSTYAFPGFLSYWANHSMFAGVLKSRRKSSDGADPIERDAAGHESVDWVMGAAMLFDRDSWSKLGGFSPAYFLYAEDTDICYRAKQLGLDVVFDRSLSVIHTQGDPPAESRHIALMRLFAGLKVFLKQHYGPSKRASVSTAVILDMLFRIVTLTILRLGRRDDLLLQNRLRGSIEVFRMFITNGHP